MNIHRRPGVGETASQILAKQREKIMGANQHCLSGCLFNALVMKGISKSMVPIGTMSEGWTMEVEIDSMVGHSLALFLNSVLLPFSGTILLLYTHYVVAYLLCTRLLTTNPRFPYTTCPFSRFYFWKI